MEIFKSWHTAEKSSQLASVFEGRIPFQVLGIVTANDDPEKKRRIKVKTQAKPTDSDWLYRLNFSPFYDPPVPEIGQTVVVSYLDGDPHTGVYLGVVTNEPNPSLEKIDDLKDEFSEVTGSVNSKVDVDYVLKAGKSVAIRNEAGAEIRLNEDGSISVICTGLRFEQLPTDLPDYGIALDLQRVKIINADDVSINNKQIATIGATDDNGDDLITKGWS